MGWNIWAQKFAIVHILSEIFICLNSIFIYVSSLLFFSVPSNPHFSCSPNRLLSPPTIILQTNLSMLRLACFPHCCPSWGCLRLGVFLLPPQPPPFTPRHQHSSLPTPTAVGMMAALLSLFVLGLGGVGWNIWAPVCAPVPISQLSALSLNTMSTPLARLPSVF